MVEADRAHIGYIRTVEQLFLLLRRQGLMLSPRDESLILKWARQGIPLRVVCRAIVECAARYREQHGEQCELPSSLSYFASGVQEEAHRYRARCSELERSTGPAAAGVDRDVEVIERLKEELVLIGRSEPNDAMLEAYRHTYRDLVALRNEVVEGVQPVDLFSRLIRLDGEHLDRVYTCLSDENRARVDSSVEKRLRSESSRLGIKGRQQRQRAIFEEELTTQHCTFRIWQEHTT